MTTPHEHRREVAEAYDRGHREGLRDRQDAFHQGWDRALDLAVEVVRQEVPDVQRRHDVEQRILALFSQARHTVTQTPAGTGPADQGRNAE